MSTKHFILKWIPWRQKSSPSPLLLKKLRVCKINDLKNRSRRNNIVIWGAPEGMESQDCVSFIKTCWETPIPSRGPIVLGICQQTPTAQESPVQYMLDSNSYLCKDAAKKKLISVFKANTYNAGGVKGARLYMSDDYSHKVQQMRKEKMPLLKELQNKGAKAFLIYPGYYQDLWLCRSSGWPIELWNWPITFKSINSQASSYGQKNNNKEKQKSHLWTSHFDLIDLCFWWHMERS